MTLKHTKIHTKGLSILRHPCKRVGISVQLYLKTKGTSRTFIENEKILDNGIKQLDSTMHVACDARVVVFGLAQVHIECGACN